MKKRKKYIANVNSVMSGSGGRAAGGSAKNVKNCLIMMKKNMFGRIKSHKMKKRELQKIMDTEELFEWTLSKSKSGWVTLPKSRKIIVKNYIHFALFLHEVAHAKICEKKPHISRNHHNVLWADEFTDLTNKYCMPNKGILKLIEMKGVVWK